MSKLGVEEEADAELPPMPPLAAPWRGKILQSLAKNKAHAHSRYVQVATVKPDGRPSNRTVVFRGFFEDTDDFTFVTDKRSNKIQDVAHNPAAEVAWYFPETREQFRISGTLTIVDHVYADECLQAGRQLAWAKMSDGGRAQFSWPHPGLVRAHFPPGEFNKAVPGPTEAPPDTFCLAVLAADQVDHLRLFDNQREVYTLVRHGCTAAAAAAAGGEDEWTTQEINP